MKRILVPIDFSLASKSALDYAGSLCKNLKANLVIVHVFQEPYPENPYAKNVVQDIIDKKRISLIEKFHAFFSPSKKLLEIMELDFRVGNPLEEIIKVRKEKKVDLLVIGTRSKHNLAEYLFGSFSSELIQKARIPVLIIPEGVTYQLIENISFATIDYKKENEVAKDLKVFAERLNANLNSFYVNVLPIDFTTLDEEVLNVKDRVRVSELGVTMVVAHSVMDGINYFLKYHPTNLLAMCAIHRTGIQKLLHSSLTQKMVYHTEIPLLVLHR